MLSSGVESLLDSSALAVLEELYAGLPESSDTERMAVSEPYGGLDAESEVPTPALARSDSLSAQHHRTSRGENFCQKTEDLGDMPMVISHGPAESRPEELLDAGGLEEDEKNKKRNFRKLDCSGGEYQSKDEEAQDAEECRAECCALTPEESWSKQEDPHLNQHEVKSLRTCRTEIAGPLKSTEENQANVQVTAETLPKLTEEVQGMKADGTRIFSKAGYRNDRVSKGPPPESNECPDVDTVMARAGVSETSVLDFLEPLKVTDIDSATEHPQETNEYNGLKAHTAMPLRTGSNIVSILETREEKLPRRDPVNEFSTSLANCQSYQQDEEKNAHDFCTGPVPKHNEPYRLSSVESCRMLFLKSSEVLCSILKSTCYLDFRNMPLENNSTAVHGMTSETPKKYLPKNIESQTPYDHGTGFVENQTSTSVPVEQVSVVRSEGLSSAKIDQREVSASIGKSYSSEFEEAAEVRRKIAVGDNVEVGSWPEAQEGANSEHCHSSVFSSVASSPEEFSKEKLKMVPSEGDKLKKDQWQLSVSDLCKDDIKENSLFMEMSNIASHEIGQTDICFYKTSSKISPPSRHHCLDLSTKLEKDSPEAQLLEKESESNTTSEELAGSLVVATEANSNHSLSSGKETNLIYTLNVPLPPVAQKSREPHHNERPPCTANEVSSRDKTWDNLSGKESIGASGTTEEQVTEIVLHKDKFKSSVSSRTFHNPNMTRKISQKNTKSSVGNRECVFTGLENEHRDTWNYNNQSIKDKCTAASTSCILSGSTHVDDVLPNSYSFNIEVDKKIEGNDNLEGEASAGYNSKKTVIFPEAHFPLACGSLLCEGDWGNRGIDLHGISDISTTKNMFWSPYTAEESAATLVRDEISNKNTEVVKQFDLCKVTDGIEIVCDRDEAKEQIGMCALQFDKIRAVDSAKAPEGNQKNKSSEQLLVRYLNKKTCVHNFGFCNSPLCPKKKELGTHEKKEVSSLAANPSEYSASICHTCPLLKNTNIQTPRAGQTEKTLHPMENQCLAYQSEIHGPVTGSKQHLESLNKPPNTGLQTMATSVEETKISVGSSQSEDVLIKTGDDLSPLSHKHARQNSFQGTLKASVVDLDSLNGVRNEDCSGYVGFISDLIEEKAIELKEHKNRCEREDKGTLEESFSDSKSHCSHMLTVKDMDVTSPKSTHCGEKFKNTSVKKKVGREVAPRRKLPKESLLDGEDCLWALIEDSRESGSKIAHLSTENYEKVLEEIPRSTLNNLSKGRKNATKLTNLASTSLLSETVHDSQAEDASDAETSPKLQYNTAPAFYPCMSILSNTCKESPPNCVDCSEVCVPYKLNAQSKDNVKEVTGSQDAIPAHSVCKENEALGSERLDQIEKCQILKRKKDEKMEVHLSDKAQQEQKSEYQEKAKITLQPSMSRSSELLCGSSNELVMSRNMKFEGPLEEMFAVRSSENKLCSTLEEVKRPKITTDIISSQFLKTQDSEMENLNLNLGYDGIPGAFGTTNKLRGPLPLKRQPGRMCKKVCTSYQLKDVRKSRKIKSSPFFEIPPEIFPKQENTLLKSLYFPCKPPTMETETAMRFVHMPRPRAKRCSLLNSLKFRKCTKEPALLSKLSAMASKLLAPAKSIRNLEPLPYSSEILPVAERYSQRRSKNLLEAFSCINRNLHSRWADSWCTKMFSFQPLALYPGESTKILFSDLSHKRPASLLDTSVFPVSFHIKLDSSPATDLTGITSRHSVHHRPVLGVMPASPSKWTFSFLLSQSHSDTTVFKEESGLDNKLHSSLSVTTPRTVALHPDRGRNAVAERRGGCSMLGLHTVLALSSPGCYRIWTRRRNLTSHIPTIQRLFISQFAQGLKGARHPASVSDDLVSSLPYSLGRVLSIWSQHGPSAHPSEITPLHSSHCKWQPSVGIANSYAVLPHLPVQNMEALQTAGHEICLETSFPLLLPKSCSLPESLPSPRRLSASELHVCALDEADDSIPACLRSQDDTELKKIEPEKRPKKVSQIRIRKTVPKPNPNLTPMGLPKPKRLKKKEFSLEEIYTNKNYKSPPPARSLETIFEEPKEKNGRLISVSQQKRKRILEFQDFTLPRKRKTRGKIKVVGSFTRAKKAALQSAELDALLSQKLMDLEAFFAKEAEQEQASSV
ncbi:PREDICTED: protein PRR14L [Charadrius vociferus]|uniref:protein PRR14L n=1 Tax=Charadrius vociferus TaxID=50402 RepID=UPI000521AD04|nr:PREDICTED: protein PRR14L [Charadrius vociferus]